MLKPQPLFFFPFPLCFGQDFGTPTSINPTEEVASGSNSAENNKAKKERLRSLDTFRGSAVLFANTCHRLPSQSVAAEMACGNTVLVCVGFTVSAASLWKRCCTQPFHPALGGSWGFSGERLTACSWFLAAVCRSGHF